MAGAAAGAGLAAELADVVALASVDGGGVVFALGARAAPQPTTRIPIETRERRAPRIARAYTALAERANNCGTLGPVRVTTETLELPQVRVLVARPQLPKGEAPRAFPVVVAWSDIFQLTPPHLRIVNRLASRGFVVIAPELYGRFVKKGTAFDFEADRQKALGASLTMKLEWIDEDVAAILEAAAKMSTSGAVGVIGWCFGGHVALRAALDKRVRAAACCYPTGVHDGKLGDRDGKAKTAGTLERVAELKGELLLVWGREDPHIPAEGRRTIHAALEAAGTRYEARLFDAEHTFMRDWGERYDGAAADDAFDAVVELFRRTL